MLTTNQLHIDGRRHTLLPATTLEARRGEVLLVQANGQERRTALSLALTGRMKPSTGTVVLGHDDSLAALRRRSAIVDAPEVNAPEHHLTIRSLAAEDLALVPFRFRDRTRPSDWLRRNGFEDILGRWIEEVDPGRLLHLQLALALANKDVELVVVDSPDRHTSDDESWLPLLTRLAAGELEHGADDGAPPRPLMVVAVVGRLPLDWDGPAVTAGEAATSGEAGQASPPDNSSEDTGPTPDTSSDEPDQAPGLDPPLTVPIPAVGGDVPTPATADGADGDTEEVPGVVGEEMPEQAAGPGDDEDSTTEAGENK